MMIQIMMIHQLVEKELYPKIKESTIINHQQWLLHLRMMELARLLKKLPQQAKVHQQPAILRPQLDQIKRCQLWTD